MSETQIEGGQILDADFASETEVQRQEFTYAADSGSVNALAATYSPAATLTDGIRLSVKVANTNTGAVTFAPNGLTAKAVKKNHDQALVAGDIEAGQIIELVYQATEDVWQMQSSLAQVASTGPSVQNILGIVPEFRLSGTTNLAVTTSDVSNITTIRYVPLASASGAVGRILLYISGAWVVKEYQEISLALGTLSASTLYNVYVYDNSGTGTLEVSTTNPTLIQDGIKCKSGDATRRFVGQIYMTSTTQTQDTVTQRLVANYYNRVLRRLYMEHSGNFATTSTTYVEDTGLGDLQWISFAEDAHWVQIKGQVHASGTGATWTLVTNITIGDGGTTQTADYDVAIRATNAFATAEDHFSIEETAVAAAGLVSRNALVKRTTTGSPSIAVTRFQANNGSSADNLSDYSHRTIQALVRC